MAEIRLSNMIKNLPEVLEVAARALQRFGEKLQQGKAAFLTYPLGAMLSIGADGYEATSRPIGEDSATGFLAAIWTILGTGVGVAVALQLSAAMPVVLTIAGVGAATLAAPRLVLGAAAGLCCMALGAVYGALTMGTGIKHSIDAWQGKSMSSVATLTVTTQPGTMMTGPMRQQMMTPSQKALEALEGASDAEREKFAKALVEKFPDMRGHMKTEAAPQEVPTALEQDVKANKPRLKTGA